MILQFRQLTLCNNTAFGVVTSVNIFSYSRYITVMSPITYKLDCNGSAVSTYYPAISKFTDRCLEKASLEITPIAHKYRSFLITYGLEEPRTLEEYTFELLNLGILWRAYGATACSVTVAPFRFMARLGEWRKTSPRLKPAIDIIRGLLLSYFLAPAPIRKTDTAPHTLNDIERLVTWLEATGDFREDAFRYIRWLGFAGALQDSTFRKHFNEILSFADWFITESETALGQYTPNVNAFNEHSVLRYQWREDRFSCLRSRSEYHANMVGAEILNRAYRTEFLSCASSTVLLPGCMRSRTPEECDGEKTARGIRCFGCDARCHVNRIREMGLRNNFDVMVIPHSTDLSRWKGREGEERHAVVGVACLSVLVEGGWELKRNDIPAQCVLLNECGCKKHWHKEGFPTQLDVRELKRIVAH